MKRLLSSLLAVLLIVGMAGSSFGAIASWLTLGRSEKISGTVVTKTRDIAAEGTAYPEQATGMFNEINKIRKENNLPTLVRNTNLTAAAKQRALEVSVSFSHTRPDGSHWRTVDKRANGENLGIDMNDYVTVTREGFMNSPDHRALILDTDFNSVEVYCMEAGDELYWVHLFSVQTAEDISGKKESAKTTAVTTTTKTEAGKPLSEAALVSLIKEAPLTNNVKTITVENPYSVTLDSLKALQTAASGATALLRADTRTEAGGFVARISINPAILTSAPAEILLGTDVDNSHTKSTQDFFSKWFTNDTQVVGIRQQGSFGGPVRVAAKLKVGNLDTDNLVFYAYDRTNNTYAQILNPNYSIDKNGFVHFDTERGGDIVISNGALARK